MDFPSGDHASELSAPCRWLTCFIPLTASVQTKTFSSKLDCHLPSPPEQSERNASCLPSGDQAGWEVEHTPGLPLVTSPMVSGEITRSQAPSCADPAGAMPVKCSSERRSAPSTVHARLVPSGEMAAETGVRTL